MCSSDLFPSHDRPTIEQFEKKEWNREEIMKHAELFAKEVFKEKIENFFDRNIGIQ